MSILCCLSGVISVSYVGSVSSVKSVINVSSLCSLSGAISVNNGYSVSSVSNLVNVSSVNS